MKRTSSHVPLSPTSENGRKRRVCLSETPRDHKGEHNWPKGEEQRRLGDYRRALLLFRVHLSIFWMLGLTTRLSATCSSFTSLKPTFLVRNIILWFNYVTNVRRYLILSQTLFNIYVSNILLTNDFRHLTEINCLYQNKINSAKWQTNK